MRQALDSDPRRVAFLLGGGSLGLLKGLTRRFFRQLGPVTECVGDICSGAGEAAQEKDFGKADSHAVEDVLASRSILLWGKNVGVSNIHLVPLLREAQKRGATLLYVDPLPPDAGLPRHEWISPHPGRDLELASGVARYLLEVEETPWAHGTVELGGLESFLARVHERSLADWAGLAGVEERALVRIGEALRARPASLHVGWGLQRRARGMDTVRALDALAALSGNLGVPGGGVSFYYARRRAFREELFDEGHEAGRTFLQAALSTELQRAEPPVDVLWISAANPVAMLPDSAALAEAIERIPFVVVCDSHPNDTTRRADAVLPVETMLEDSDVLGAYGHHMLAASRTVLARPEHVRSDLEILQELAGRFGHADAMQGSRREWKQRLLRPELAEHGIDVSALEEAPRLSPFAENPLFADGQVPTKSGRVELLDRYVPPEPECEEFPLWLFSNSHRKSQSSQWADGESGMLPVRVHPAATPGLAEGSRVRIVSGNGSLFAHLVHDERMRPDTALVPKGGSLDLGRCANVLVAPRTTDGGGGAAYLDTRVRIEEAPEGK